MDTVKLPLVLALIVVACGIFSIPFGIILGIPVGMEVLEVFLLSLLLLVISSELEEILVELRRDR